MPEGHEQNGAPAVFEYRQQLPADPAARDLLKSAMIGSLELASSLVMGMGGASTFVADGLRLCFEKIPKDGPALDLVYQIASIRSLTNYGNGSYSPGTTLLGAFRTSTTEDGGKT